MTYDTGRYNNGPYDGPPTGAAETLAALAVLADIRKLARKRLVWRTQLAKAFAAHGLNIDHL